MIAGQTILLVGASGGIGSALARQLAARGAAVILVGRQRERLEALAQEIWQARGAASMLTADLAEGASALVAQVRATIGEVDMLINCAGMQTFCQAADEDGDDTARLFATNVVGPIQLINALLPQMLARGHGRIVNVGSIFGSIGFPCFASYSASKFALRGYSEALRRELAGSGVRVTYVAPRYTRTAFNRDAVARMADALGMNQDAPEAVAEQVIAAIERDAADAYLGWPEKFFVRLNALLPRLVDGSLMKQAARMRPFAARAASRGPAA